tara:strand:+ start:1457 stop:1870 length:414 start_codon:yes stop_codon:yes gene_type:complete
MGHRLTIQTKILEVIKAGSFPVVQYDPTTGCPTLTGECVPPNVWVNEVQGSVTDSSRRGARTREFSLTPWIFEARIKFPVEVDTEEFITSELSEVKFQDGTTLIVVNAGSYRVEHPVGQGSQKGTELIISLTVNTRR